jgi:hypothetical protein
MAVGTLPDEDAARAKLRRALVELRSGLGRCPAVEDVSWMGTQVAMAAADATNGALRRAEGCAAELADLQAISEASIVLLAVSRSSFAVVRELLTVLIASIDAVA